MKDTIEGLNECVRIEELRTYVIIKELFLENGQKQNTILVNLDDEIWEFNDKSEAVGIAKAFEKNSDSGWKYQVKEIRCGL